MAIIILFLRDSIVIIVIILVIVIIISSTLNLIYFIHQHLIIHFLSILLLISCLAIPFPKRSH